MTDRMLTLQNTPNEAGIEISGDFLDLDTLYMALHTVVGDEGEFSQYESARLRVLSVCYDLRHAIMGDREVVFIENGMDEDKMKHLGIITQEKNLYYKCAVYFPEALFVTMALNDFIRLYAKKKVKSVPFPLQDKHNLWDPFIANVRLFQSEVVKCVKQTVTDASFRRMLNLLHHDYPWMNGYITQYLDMQNIRYLNMNKEERRKALPSMVKRLVEQGTEYRQMERDIKDMANEHNCSIDDIRLNLEYPEEIEW